MTILKRIDEHDLVQRHISTDNAVRVLKCWLMIDYEPARRTEHVWCEGKLLPEVKHRIEPYTSKRSVVAWYAIQSNCSMC